MNTKKLNNKLWCLPKNEFTYSSVVEYAYETDRDCRRYGCDSICRCARFSKIEITSIDILAFVHAIAGSYKIIRKNLKDYSELVRLKKNQNLDCFEYFVDRLARLHKVYSTDNWEISTCSGYYGEEISSIYCTNFSEFGVDVNTLVGMSLREKIEFVLLKEYGYLLDELKDKKWSQKTINKKDVILNSDYYKKIGVDEYSLLDHSPIGIYLRMGDKYRLIDGYHRFTSTKEDNFQALVGA